jgi:photosystem II stability/assembly factor-like uncharacterized protein
MKNRRDVVFCALLLLVYYGIACSARTQAPDMKLFGRSNGWIRFDQVILSTHDGGKTWQDISPHSAPGEAVLQAQFVDPDHGWILLSNPDEDDGDFHNDWIYKILSTVDGGASWSASTIPRLNPPLEDGRQPDMVFRDALHGWIGIGSGNTAFNGSRLLTTSDGGKTWKESPRGVPFAADLSTDPSGALWATGQDGEGAHLAVSRDDGRTFRAAILNPGPASQNDYERLYDNPVFESRKSGHEVVTFWESMSDAGYSVLFVTSDGGRTWRKDGTITGVQPWRIPHTALLGTAWLVSVRDSAAGGAVRVKRGTDFTISEHSNVSPCSFSFANSQIGWMNCASGLRSTLDGGVTWTDISPRFQNGVLVPSSANPRPIRKP